MEGQDNKLSLQKKNRKGGNSAMYCEKTAGLREKNSNCILKENS